MAGSIARKAEFAVVGAGISGLAAAFWLKRAGRPVVLIEREPRPGGCIRTLRHEGWIFEQGPNTVTSNGGAVDRLVADAGLAGEKQSASRAAGRRFIYKADDGRGRLLPLPAGPAAFLASPLLSPGAKLALLREPFLPPRREGGEESVASFVRRRLGAEYLDYLVGPFVSGVYAGDPEKLSLRWAVKAIHRLEAEHGGLIRGALARRKGPAPRGDLISFREGLETLPRALAGALGDDLVLGAPVTALRREGGGFRLEARPGGEGGGLTVQAEQVVLAVPAKAAAALTAPFLPEGRETLAAIPYAPVASVALGFRDAALGERVQGFGFLAPRTEGLRLLGCLFSSSLFPGRAPAGAVALTALAGGATDPGVLELTDAALLERVLADLRRALGAFPDPVFTRITRWPRAIPQYNLGHGRFVDLARGLEEANPGLHVGGNLLEGISVADCVENAARLCERLLAPAREEAPRASARTAGAFFDTVPPVC